MKGQKKPRLGIAGPEATRIVDRFAVLAISLPNELLSSSIIDTGVAADGMDHLSLQAA